VQVVGPEQVKLPLRLKSEGKVTSRTPAEIVVEGLRLKVTEAIRLLLVMLSSTGLLDHLDCHHFKGAGSRPELKTPIVWSAQAEKLSRRSNVPRGIILQPS
jgi:hypothetical protein